MRGFATARAVDLSQFGCCEAERFGRIVPVRRAGSLHGRGTKFGSGGAKAPNLKQATGALAPRRKVFGGFELQQKFSEQSPREKARGAKLFEG